MQVSFRMELTLQTGFLIQRGTILQTPTPKYSGLCCGLSHWRNQKEQLPDIIQWEYEFLLNYIKGPNPVFLGTLSCHVVKQELRLHQGSSEINILKSETTLLKNCLLIWGFFPHNLQCFSITLQLHMWYSAKSPESITEDEGTLSLNIGGEHANTGSAFRSDICNRQKKLF